ncbi:MAG: DUF2809 domain-containing protein [Clostridiaceae bacterium]|nr:DUF2809 domain-containing protein [Clostridiaceae bacterium]
MRINRKYLFSFFILLMIEIIIALFVHDTFIRPYIGDVLVVILLYTLIRGLIQKTIKFLPVYLFIFASTVEFAQYYHIVKSLNLENNKVISTIIGTSYDIKDIINYLIATVILIMWEKIVKNVTRTK